MAVVPLLALLLVGLGLSSALSPAPSAAPSPFVSPDHGPLPPLRVLVHRGKGRGGEERGGKGRGGEGPLPSSVVVAPLPPLPPDPVFLLRLGNGSEVPGAVLDAEHDALFSLCGGKGGRDEPPSLLPSLLLPPSHLHCAAFGTTTALVGPRVVLLFPCEISGGQAVCSDAPAAARVVEVVTVTVPVPVPVEDAEGGQGRRIAAAVDEEDTTIPPQPGDPDTKDAVWSGVGGREGSRAGAGLIALLLHAMVAAAAAAAR